MYERKVKLSKISTYRKVNISSSVPAFSIKFGKNNFKYFPLYIRVNLTLNVKDYMHPSCSSNSTSSKIQDSNVGVSFTLALRSLFKVNTTLNTIQLSPPQLSIAKRKTASSPLPSVYPLDPSLSTLRPSPLRSTSRGPTTVDKAFNT